VSLKLNYAECAQWNLTCVNTYRTAAAIATVIDSLRSKDAKTLEKLGSRKPCCIGARSVSSLRAGMAPAWVVEDEGNQTGEVGCLCRVVVDGPKEE
jgi:hypothetical protein